MLNGIMSIIEPVHIPELELPLLDWNTRSIVAAAMLDELWFVTPLMVYWLLVVAPDPLICVMNPKVIAPVMPTFVLFAAVLEIRNV